MSPRQTCCRCHKSTMDYMTEYIDRRTKWEVLNLRPVREVVFHTCRSCFGDGPLPDATQEPSRDVLIRENWRGATCTTCAGPIVRTFDRRSWLHVLRQDWIDNVHQAAPVPEPAATS